jgi:hypothetical protein
LEEEIILSADGIVIGDRALFSPEKSLDGHWPWGNLFERFSIWSKQEKGD